MSIACVVLVLAITTLSAFIRLAGAGLGCEPWPQCYGQHLLGAHGPALAQAVAMARIVHRFAAVAALALIIALVMRTLGATPMRWREGRFALGLLGLALFLAILGGWTAQARVPAVGLGNLLAGFAMVAVSWRLVLATSAREAPAVVAPGWIWAAIALLIAQVVLGGLVSAGHAGVSCPQLASCDIAHGSWQALNPWHEPSFDAADPMNARAAPAQWMHRGGAALLLAVLVPLGVTAWRRGRAAGAVVLALLAAQLLLGAVLVTHGLPLALALAHNVVAALLLAALASLAAAGRPA